MFGRDKNNSLFLVFDDIRQKIQQDGGFVVRPTVEECQLENKTIIHYHYVRSTSEGGTDLLSIMPYPHHRQLINSERTNNCRELLNKTGKSSLSSQ